MYCLIHSPDLELLERPSEYVHVFTKNENLKFIGNCLADIVVTSPVDAHGVDKYCFNAFLPK